MLIHCPLHYRKTFFKVTEDQIYWQLKLSEESLLGPSPASLIYLNNEHVLLCNLLHLHDSDCVSAVTVCVACQWVHLFRYQGLEIIRPQVLGEIVAEKAKPGAEWRERRQVRRRRSSHYQIIRERESDRCERGESRWWTVPLCIVTLYYKLVWTLAEECLYQRWGAIMCLVTRHMSHHDDTKPGNTPVKITLELKHHKTVAVTTCCGGWLLPMKLFK